MTLPAATRLGSCACALLLCTALPGCSEGPRTAVQLVLTPNPEISTAEELLAAVARVSLTVDAAEGLAGVSAAGPLEDGGTAVDVDGDGVLEARFDGPPLDGARLPVLEVGLARNADRELAFRVLGLSAGGETVAEGGAAARCPAGQVRKVGTPFNIAPRARPPRVLLVQPADGAQLVPLALISALVVFSTTIDEGSLDGQVRLLDPDGREVPLTLTLETLVVTGSPFSRDERTLLTLGFHLPMNMGTEARHTIELGTGIRSTAGHALDQDPSTPAPDAFVSHFFAPGLVGGGPEPCDQCPEGYGCVPEHPGCVPILACPAECPPLSICDADQQQCVPDCRAYGFCGDATRTCEERTGLCR